MNAGNIEVLKYTFLLNRSLTKLSLADNNLGDAGGLFLQSNSSLIDLNLANNGMTRRGACALSSALVGNCTLQQLELHGNQIGDEGVNHLAKIVASHPTLTYLGLAFNNITDFGITILAQAVRSITHRSVTPDFLRILQAFRPSNLAALQLAFEENQRTMQPVLSTVSQTALAGKSSDESVSAEVKPPFLTAAMASQQRKHEFSKQLEEDSTVFDDKVKKRSVF